MPKLPMDYSKCCIYKIEHDDDESLVYIGHTTNFDKRKTQHKGSCKNDNDKHYNLKIYQMIRQNGGWDAFKMLEVEKYPCNDKREAERRENEVMKELKTSMNTKKSFRTQDEKTEYHTNYRELHKEKIQEYKKEYYKSNKPKIQERMKEYRENNKPKIQEREKEYRENNKPKIQEYKKKYQKNNKLKINEKVKCECGCDVMKRYLKRHQATKKHLDKMKKI